MARPPSPDRLQKLLQEALAHHRAGRLDLAQQGYKAALKLDPTNGNANRLLGALLLQRRNLTEARPYLQAAAKAEPRVPNSHYFLGRLHAEERRLAAAAAAFEACLRLQPGHVDALVMLAIVQMNTGQEAQSVKTLETALQSAPQSIDARLNLAEVYARLGNIDAAARMAKAARALAPSLTATIAKEGAIGLRVCDWTAARRLDQLDLQSVIDGIDGYAFGELAGFCLLPWKANAETMRRLSALVAPPPAPRPLAAPAGIRQRDRRIRVGYLSSDLRRHAVGQLMAGVIAAHDRAEMDIVDLSILADDPSDSVRQEIQGNASEVVFLDGVTGPDLAKAIHTARIDVVVDLNGWTLNSGLTELRHRPAPVQMTYLGYPGTSGAGYVDYIIGDPSVTPPGHEAEFSERVIRLPHCYLPFDRARQPALDIPSRAECGLPEGATVFCGYNAAYKLTDDLADSWARILARVPDSVLWLRWESDLQAENLNREFAARGIAPERLVFARREASFARHIGRQSHAAVFLDSFYYNAHTTGLDALWAGVPLVSRTGPTFAGRVGTSFLRVLGFDDLIATSTAAYEDSAVALATDPARLATVRQRLAEARATSPLFDATQMARHLEAAYATAWRRHCDGQPPASFDVAPIA